MSWIRGASSRAVRTARCRRVLFAGALGCAAPATACLPYPVGTTAQPVEVGKTRVSTSMYFIPNGVSLRDEYDTASRAPAAPLRGTDFELRRGLDSVSDLALHVTSFSGFVLDYKRKLDASGDTTAAATALLVGAGIVNFGDHAYGEVGVLHSGRSSGGVVPCGGVRVMQVVPIAPEAVSDRPTMGGFFGVRLPFGEIDASPELGVYYDHSALGVRRGDLLIVPSLTFAATRRPRRSGDAAPPPVFAPPRGVGGAGPIYPLPIPRSTSAPRTPPQKPTAAGPVGAPSGARPTPPPSVPRASGGASRRPVRRPARP